jgi:hypothetical protein
MQASWLHRQERHHADPERTLSRGLGPVDRDDVPLPFSHPKGHRVSPTYLAVLVVGAAVGLWLLETTIRRTDVGASLVLGLFVLQLLLEHVFLGVAVGPLNIFASDLLIAVLLGGSIARMLRMPRLTNPQRLMVLFFLLVAWSMARSLVDADSVEAVAGARSYLQFISAALYFSTVEPNREFFDRIASLWFFAAAALCALALMRWVSNAVGITGGVFGSGQSLRVLPSSGALLIAQAAILALPLMGQRSRRLLRWLTPVFLVFVLILQHRTVWIVTIISVVYLLYRERSLTKNLLGAIGAGLALLAVLTFTVLENHDLEVTESLAESAQNTDTFSWRAAGWRALMRDAGPDGMAEWVVGRPMGVGWDRIMIHGPTIVTVGVSPHNYYLEALLRVGIIGLAAILAVYAMALDGTRRGFPHDRGGDRLLSANALHVVIALHLVYYLSYSNDPAQGLLLGLGCALAVGAASQPFNLASASQARV